MAKRNFIFILGVLAATAIVGELALNFHSSFKTRKNDASRQQGEFTILLLGDSVAGEGINTFPYFLEGDLKKGFPNSTVVNLFKPALRSREVIQNLPSNVALYNPSLIIVLAGLADSNSDKSYSFANNFYSKTYTYLKVYLAQKRVWLLNLRSSVELALYRMGIYELQDLSLRANNKLFWKIVREDLPEKKLYKKCIIAGEALAKKFTEDQNPIKAVRKLANCYLYSKQEDRGIKFLEEYAQRLSPQYKSDVLGFKSELLLAKNDIESSKKSLEGIDLQGRLKTVLELLTAKKEKPSKTLEKDQELIDYFKSVKFPINSAMVSRFKKIAEFAEQSESPLLIMQYPNANAEQFQKILPKSSSYVSLFDSNSALITYAHKYHTSLDQLFAADLIHLTPAGHRLIAEALAEHIFDHFGRKESSANE